MEEVRAQLKQLAERANDLAEFANLIADDPTSRPVSSHPPGALQRHGPIYSRRSLPRQDVSTTRREEAPAPTGTPV